MSQFKFTIRHFHFQSVGIPSSDSWQHSRYTAAALHAARRAKERTDPQLQRPSKCRLAVLAVEVGGRWSEEAANFLRQLVHAKARTVAATLRQSTVTALVARWSVVRPLHACGPGSFGNLIGLPATRWPVQPRWGSTSLAPRHPS